MVVDTIVSAPTLEEKMSFHAPKSLLGSEVAVSINHNFLSGWEGNGAIETTLFQFPLQPW